MKEPMASSEIGFQIVEPSLRNMEERNEGMREYDAQQQKRGRVALERIGAWTKTYFGNTYGGMCRNELGT